MVHALHKCMPGPLLGLVPYACASPRVCAVTDPTPRHPTRGAEVNEDAIADAVSQVLPIFSVRRALVRDVQVKVRGRSALALAEYRCPLPAPL